MIIITVSNLSIGKKLKCPAATQDLKLNTKNRDAAIKADHIQYGPLNVDEPGDYWQEVVILGLKVVQLKMMTSQRIGKNEMKKA